MDPRGDAIPQDGGGAGIASKRTPLGGGSDGSQARYSPKRPMRVVISRD